VLCAAILGAAGTHNRPALHGAALLWTLATMYLLYLIARRLFDPVTGFAAALLYGLFPGWGDYRNQAFNGELIMNLPVVAALALTLRPSRSLLRLELCCAGALVAVAFLLKRPSGVAGAALGCNLLDPADRRRAGLTWTQTLIQVALLASGFIVALGGAGLMLARAGILHDAIYWTVRSQAAAFGVGTWVYWDRALSNGAFFVLELAPLLLAVVLSVRSSIRHERVWRVRGPELRALLLLLLAVSLIGVGVNGQWLFHYYLQLIPPLALLAAPQALALWRSTHRGPCARLNGTAYRGWLAVSALVFLVAVTAGFARPGTVPDAALYVRAHSSPENRIYVWGQGDAKVGMHLDADRQPATRSIIDTDAVRERPVYVMSRYPFFRDYQADHYQVVFRGVTGIVYRRTEAGSAAP